MSFGFGSNNNTGGGFGGFGSTNNNTSTGFGAPNNTTSGGSLFGGNTATSGGFGGFGASNNAQQSNPFAPKTGGFGTNTATSTGGGGLFGGGTSTAGGFGSGGGFGSAANTNTGGFGTSTGGGLFGQNKPATTGFGASNTGGSLFGGGNSTGGFGSNNTTANSNPFGSTTNTNTGFGGNTGGGAFGGFGASTAGNNNNGTATTPFQAFQEKEPTGTGMQAFQSITFQDPYKGKSFEELRVEDYAQGRRYGNTNGQAGAFGQSTGFGGFGGTNTATNASSGGGLFGSTTATTGGTGFGGFGANSNTNTTSGFGQNNTGGGLFGQNKPAGGGLFGNTAASSAPATGGFGTSTTGSTGGLFGNTSNTNTGGFGQNSTTGGGLFGSTNSQQQNSNPFGQSSTNTGGGLFGQQQNKPAGGGLFGNTNTSTNTGGGLFGNTNNQQQNSNPFGQSGNTGGGLFGNANNQTQNKPGGFSFGNSTNTGGTGFGTSTSTGGGLFGNNNTQQQNTTGGGLFGNQNKPAGGGLFGNTSNTNTGGGLFGNNNNNQTQNTGGGLFGNSTNNNSGGGLFGNQNKPAGNSLFGNTNNSGGGLFGNTQNNQSGNAGNSLFGSTNQGQQNQGNSLFGGSFGQSQNQQQQNSLHASITGSPYGNEQLFQSLATNNPPVGPLATPLNGAKPTPRKTPSLMASMRLNSPVYTPRGGSLGRTGGYGFSYSTYGTPGSAFSGNLTPGASSLLRPTGSFSSALSSRLNKSVSMGNLRADGTPGEGRSLLRDSALLPPGSGRFGGGAGSIRKLNIDRSLRTDLFDRRPEPQEERRVRYDSTAETPAEIPRNSNALVRTESPDTEQDAESPALIKAPPQNGAPRQPEMSQVNGANSLSTVHEEPPRPGSAPATQKSKPPSSNSGIIKDKVAGEYYTNPPLKDLKNMSRAQLQKLGKFTVGRNGIGWIDFSACDLSTTDLDDICGGIVQLTARSATVYEDNANKPAMGKGLNVPATIYLENSWPRSQGGRKGVMDRGSREYAKHIARLKRVEGTNFVDYDPETGIWKFTVEHFTTYGLDDDDEDEDFTESEMQVESSGLSDAPASATSAGQQQQEDQSMRSVEEDEGEMDDTFQFKLAGRSQISVPGGFDGPNVTYDYDDPSGDEQMEEEHPGSSALAAQSPGSAAPSLIESDAEEQETEQNLHDISMSGALVQAGEDDEAEEEPEIMPGSFVPQEPRLLRSILKPSRGLDALASPQKLATESWEEQLQRTISPKKRDRAALKEMQQSLLKSTMHAGLDQSIGAMDSPFKQSLMGKSVGGLNQSYLARKSAKKGKVTIMEEDEEGMGRSQAFRTSMDIMKSLWADEGRKSSKKGGLEYPYAKRPRLSESTLDQNDVDFHNCVKPSFAADGTLVYASSGPDPQLDGIMRQSKVPIVGEHADVRFAKFVEPEDFVKGTLDILWAKTKVEKERSGLPVARLDDEINFADLLRSEAAAVSMKGQEKAIWSLCSVLFDPLEVAAQDMIEEGMDVDIYDEQLRKDAFTVLWRELVEEDVQRQLRAAKTAEEKAIILLSKNDVEGACDVLAAAKDFKLAMLASQLRGATDSFRSAMAQQIKAWRDRMDWSEMAEAVRTLYSICAGILGTVQGQNGAPEDRAQGVHIAERWGLTWLQSLGLRVWYGGHQTLEEAIRVFETDLKLGVESAKPTGPWGGEDTLWALCRLFASPAEKADLGALCEPANVSGSVLNSRVAWQLALLLRTKGIIQIADKAQDQLFASLTASFAAELEAAGHLVPAARVLLHSRETEKVRRMAITSLIQRNAANIAYPVPESLDSEEPDFRVLTIELGIPHSTILAAKALHAQVQGDLHQQAKLLLAAGLAQEAHEVLATSVGPAAVIERDYDGLADVLVEFPRSKPSGWEAQGEVYQNFVKLMRLSKSKREGVEGENLVLALRAGLVKMEDGLKGKGLEERVAVAEMRREVEVVAREAGVDGEEDGMQMAGVSGTQRTGKELWECYLRAMGAVV